MDLAELQRKLYAAARVDRPPDTVPYVFEKRVMAHIAAMQARVHFDWSRALARAAVACLAVGLLSVAWSYLDDTTETAGFSPDLSDQFENTVLAAAYAEPAPADATW